MQYTAKRNPLDFCSSNTELLPISPSRASQTKQALKLFEFENSNKNKKL